MDKATIAPPQQYKRAFCFVALGIFIGIMIHFFCAATYVCLETFPLQIYFDVGGLSDSHFPRAKGLDLVEQLKQITLQTYYVKYFALFVFCGAFLVPLFEYFFRGSKFTWSRLVPLLLTCFLISLILHSFRHS